MSVLLSTSKVKKSPSQPPRYRCLADLPDTLVVQVTDEDIALGIRSSPRDCPRARAIRRTLTLEHGFKTIVRVGLDVEVHLGLLPARYYDQAWYDRLGILLYDKFGRMKPHTLILHGR